MLLSALGMELGCYKYLLPNCYADVVAKLLWLFFQAVLMCIVKIVIVFKDLPAVERISNYTQNL